MSTERQRATEGPEQITTIGTTADGIEVFQRWLALEQKAEESAEPISACDRVIELGMEGTVHEIAHLMTLRASVDALIHNLQGELRNHFDAVIGRARSVPLPSGSDRN